MMAAAPSFLPAQQRFLPAQQRFLPAQQRFLETENHVTTDIAIYQGGFGSGKTFVGAWLGIFLCKKYPGIHGLVVAKTVPMLRDTIQRMYFQHLDTLKLVKGKDYEFNKTENRLVFQCFGGSEVLFRSLDDWEKIKSLNVGFVEAEEVSMLTEADFLALLSRLRQVGVPRKRFFGHTNPQAKKDWIYKYFSKDKIIQSDDGLIHYRRVLAPTTENTHLSADYIKTMQDAYDPEYFRIYVMGEDHDYTAGLVCKNFTQANIDLNVVYDPNRTIYLSCDFNIDPMSWVLAHRIGDEFHFFDELVVENATTSETVELLYSRHSPHVGGVGRYVGHTAGWVITGDASGDNRGTKAQSALTTDYTIIRSRMSGLGFKHVSLDLLEKNPPVSDRVTSWNANLLTSSNVRKIKIHPQCKHLIENCGSLHYVEGSSQIWEPTKNDIQKNPKLKFVKHIFDAASYLVYRYSPISSIYHDNPNRVKQVIRDQTFSPRR